MGRLDSGNATPWRSCLHSRSPAELCDWRPAARKSLEALRRCDAASVSVRVCLSLQRDARHQQIWHSRRGGLNSSPRASPAIEPVTKVQIYVN